MDNSRERTSGKLWITNLQLLRDCALPHSAVVNFVDTSGAGLGDVARLHRLSRRARVILLYQPPDRLTWLLCLLRLLTPLRMAHLVLVDVIFTKPGRGCDSRLRQAAKTVLYGQVDLFVSFMKDTSALQRYFDIGPERCRFIPFKPNRVARQRAGLSAVSRGYVHMGGVSRRDFATFCRAMELVGYPGVIVTHCQTGRAFHETYFDGAVPPNVALVEHDGNQESWVKWLEEAEFVVICVTDDSITPSGVSPSLEAMCLEKCVIITEGYATRGVLENGRTAIVVPPQDPESLAAAIQRVWEDKELRESIARRGRLYAESLGGERELIQRVADAAAEHFRCLRDLP